MKLTLPITRNCSNNRAEMAKGRNRLSHMGNSRNGVRDSPDIDLFLQYKRVKGAEKKNFQGRDNHIGEGEISPDKPEKVPRIKICHPLVTPPHRRLFMIGNEARKEYYFVSTLKDTEGVVLFIHI